MIVNYRPITNLWEEDSSIQIEITYIDRGNEFIKEKYDKGTVVTLCNCTNTRDRYRFKGWDVSPLATTVEYKAGETMIVNRHVIFYAVWEKINSESAPKTDDVITFIKIFDGLDTIPNDFEINWIVQTVCDDVTYSEMRTLSLNNATNIDRDSMMIDWKVPHYTSNGGATESSSVTVVESCDVSGYSYTLSAVKNSTTKVDVDNENHMIVDLSYSLSSNGATLMLTNKYTKEHPV